MNSTQITKLISEVIWLEPEDFQQAAEISDRVTGEARQWRTYLNVLALRGFEQWIEKRVAEVPVNREHCSVLQPHYAHVIDAVCNLKIGDFKVCLIATESLSNDVAVPRAVVDLPEFAAHYYVAVEILDEQKQVTIQGFLSYEQLVNYRRSVNLEARPDWSYQLPRSLFNTDLNHLLVYLRYLEPSAIASETHPTTSSLTLAELEALLSDLQSLDRKLWQSLTWEQGAVVLRNPELLDLLYRWQTQPQRTPALAIRIQEIFALLTQKAVNAALWLRDEMDELAKSLFWKPLPALTFATTAMRRTADKYQVLARELRQKKGVVIPPQAGGSYRELDLDGIALQLCAVTWTLPGDSQEWVLLLILEACPGSKLPTGSILRVSQLAGVVSEAVLADEPYLYACVAGGWDEQFVVSVALSNQASLTLPPFGFELG